MNRARNIVGGHADAYEKVLKDARDVAIGEVTNEAASLRANAVVGVALDFEVLGSRSSIFVASADRTEVTVE